MILPEAGKPARTASLARTEVLARICQSTTGMTSPAIPREYRRAGTPAGTPDLLEQLTDRLIDYRAEVHRATNTDLPDVLARVLAYRRITRLVVPDGLPAHWLATAQIRPIADVDLTVAELDGCDGTISTCAVAIAETGTIVLDAGAGQGRRALSLVPDYLLVVVRAEQVMAIVADACAVLPVGRPQTWISGPSATSDIELKRVEGVHGPRTLDVVLLTAAKGEAEPGGSRSHSHS